MTAHQIKPRPASLEKPHRDKDYLDSLKRRPCDCGCNRYRKGRMHPAHTGSRGMGISQKADDRDAITLFDECHARYHAIGEKAFSEEKGLNLKQVANRVYGEFQRRRAA